MSYHDGRSDDPRFRPGNDQFGIPEDPTKLDLKARGQIGRHGPTDSNALLGKMLDEIHKQNQDEHSFQIVQQQADTNRQLMAVFNVPFDYNCIEMNVAFGVVAVTCSALVSTDKSALFIALPVVPLYTPFDYLFGASALICGDTVGTPAVVPVAQTVPGSQVRFPMRKAGTVSIWIHPTSYLDERHNIFPTGYADICEFSGQIMQLRF